ncbi:MAG: glycosyltransferase family 1 protein, partial [Chitinophagaceae bacterium]
HGMEIVALEILRELQQRQSDHQYAVFVKDDVDHGCLEESKKVSINILKDAPFPIWEQSSLPIAVNNSNADILHCTSNTAPLFSKLPTIVTIHDLIYMESLNFSGSIYQNFGNIYRRLIVPRIARKASIILTVSEYEKQVIVKRLKLREDKVRVIYNGVNSQFRQIEDKALLEEFRNKHDLPEKFLLHFANTAPKKNTLGVLRAFSLYSSSVPKPLPLVLTDCSRTHICDLLNQINAPGLIDQIKILDYIEFSNIPYLLNLATLFLYPSHRESFGMPLIEAMACGVPVITSNTSALPEIAGGAACMIDPKDPAEMCQHIIALLSNNELYQNKKALGLKNSERFSWKIAAEKTIDVYNELAVTKQTTKYYNYKPANLLSA